VSRRDTRSGTLGGFQTSRDGAPTAKPSTPRRDAAASAAARALVLLAAAALAPLPACFHPDHPACAFSCVEPPQSCPPGFTCEADGLCHDRSNPGLCLIDPVVDASGDGDGAAEASGDDGGGSDAGAD